MSKVVRKSGPESRRYLREFVNSVISKDYANANANLTAAVKATIKAKVINVLEENPNEE